MLIPDIGHGLRHSIETSTRTKSQASNLPRRDSYMTRSRSAALAATAAKEDPSTGPVAALDHMETCGRGTELDVVSESTDQVSDITSIASYDISHFANDTPAPTRSSSSSRSRLGTAVAATAASSSLPPRASRLSSIPSRMPSSSRGRGRSSGKSSGASRPDLPPQ